MENYCVLGGRKLRYKDCLLKLNSKGVEPHKINENKPKDPGVATQPGKIKKNVFYYGKGLVWFQWFSMGNLCVLGGVKLKYKDCRLKLTGKMTRNKWKLTKRSQGLLPSPGKLKK